MKALLHYRAGPQLRERLRSVKTIEIVTVDETDDAAFRREIVDAEVLLHVLEPVTATMLASARKLRLIQKIGVGLNTIDHAAAAARGVKVANMPGTNSAAVAEHTLMLILAVLRQVVTLDAATRRGAGWTLPPEALERSGEIGGRTVGLLGYGSVARHLAPVLQALGARVIYHARARPPDNPPGYVSLESLVSGADILSLHVPLTNETRSLIDANMIARMKPGAILVNAARGELVDEAALAAALRNGALAGAALDVFTAEPVKPDNPLLQLSNVVLTPHVAWLTPETIDRSLEVVLENVRRLQDNQPLLHEARFTPT
jgi:phosphoglycerate dehydrogenase-like enzyme